MVVCFGVLLVVELCYLVGSVFDIQNGTGLKENIHQSRFFLMAKSHRETKTPRRLVFLTFKE
jgi:hypothetical protein